MGTSFFSRIEGLMSGKPRGRYLTYLLPEVIREYPRSIRAVVDSILTYRPDDHEIDTEWTWSGIKKGRRADIAVISKSSSDVLALVEMKYKDHKSDASSEQLKEYLEYCHKNRINFRYITQFEDIPTSDAELFGRPRYKDLAKHITYETLYRSLLQYRDKSPSIRLLCDYLRENTPMFEPLSKDDSSLKLLMLRSLSIAERQGLGRLHANERVLSGVPRVFQQALYNMEAISNSIRRRINGPFFKQRATIDYLFKSEFRKDKLLKYINKSQDEKWIEIDRNQIRSGRFVIYSQNKMVTPNPSDYLYLEFGYYYYIDTFDKKNPIHSYLYSSYYGKSASGGGTYCEAHNSLSKFDRSTKSLLDLILKSTDLAIQDFPSHYQKSLESIRSRF